MVLGCTVAELGQRLTSAELTEWMAYFRLEPFGPDAESWRAGVVAATVANVHRGEKSKAFQPADFMPGWKPPPEKPSLPAGLAGFRALAQRSRAGGR